MSGKDDKQKLYIAIGAAAVAVVGGAAIYHFWYKKKNAASEGEAEHRSHSAHHERQAKAGHKGDNKSNKARVDSALASIDFARATKISKDQITTIWEKYDADRNGSLDASEIKALVKEVLGQIAQEKNSLTKYMAAMFDENTAADHKTEIHGRLKNLHSELHASADGVAKQLMNRLDANRDGKISKEEFVQAFAQWLEQYHTNEIRDYLTPEGPAAPRTPAHKDQHNVSVAH